MDAVQIEREVRAIIRRERKRLMRRNAKVGVELMAKGKAERAKMAFDRAKHFRDLTR